MKSDMGTAPRYQSYVLRLRLVEHRGDGEEVCQAMLQSVATKEIRYFQDLESLNAFLKKQSDGLSVAATADD